MTTCCSLQCEKRHDCAKHCFNNVGNYPSEDYFTFGHGSISIKGCVVEHWCGEFGDYKMFEPIEKIGVAEKMINIVDMARGMENIKNFYGCEPIEIVDINFKDYTYIANITLKNGDKWKIEYAGQVRMVKEF